MCSFLITNKLIKYIETISKLNKKLNYKLKFRGPNHTEIKLINDITFIQGDAENLPLDSNSVDYLTISYGLRNISNCDVVLQEFYRVLKPGGKLGILEFSKPKPKLIRAIFGLYFHHILPRIGSCFSRSNAYSYLPESVDFFPTRHDICRKIIYSGFKRAEIHDLTFGISTVFLGFKTDE